MQRCTERERRFVWAYLECGQQTEAARKAGYSDTADGARVRAHEVMHRERVLEAIDEVGRKAFRALLLPAVMAAGKLIADSKARGHQAAVFSTLSRLGIVERQGVDVKVTGEVTVSHTDAAVESLRILKDMGVGREKLEELYGYSGLERYERLLAAKGGVKQIEGQAVDVSRETREGQE